MDTYLRKILKLVRPGGSTKDCVGSTKDRGDAMLTSIKLEKINEQKRPERTLEKYSKDLFMFSWMCSQGSPQDRNDANMRKRHFSTQIPSSVASASTTYHGALLHTRAEPYSFANRLVPTNPVSRAIFLGLKLSNRLERVQTGDPHNLKYHVYTSDHHRF